MGRSRADNMAFKYFILLALALPAVLATPTLKAEDENQACNGTKLDAITKELSNFKTCLRDLLNTKPDNTMDTRLCKTIEDAEKLKAPVVTAAAACKKSHNETNMALDFMISMMNISVQHKDILTPERVKCINESMKELKQCVNNTIPGQGKLADNLGHKDVLSLQILHLNFQPSELKKGQDLQKCISDVWSKKAQCSDISKISDKLFEKGFENIPKSDTTVPGTGSAGREIARSLIMIASLLVVL